MQVLNIFCVCVIFKLVVANRPHIIMIIPDDMGWNDVGFHGSNQIPTPNIDALAYNGVIMNKYYTQHTCTPSRAALMTGNYPIRTGMQGYPIKAGEDRALPESMPTLPQKLKELGYRTHLVGKWHLGYAHKNDTPNSKGFDTFFGYWNGYISYLDYKSRFKGNDGFDLHENLTPAKIQGRYATDLFTDRALEILEDHDSKEPLFLMICHLAAHTGNEENGNALTTPDLIETNKRFGYVTDERRRNYTHIVSNLDDSVGKVVKKLGEKGLLKDSVVIYFHDNGAQTNGGLHENSGSNWPLRGQKFSIFEGAIRGTCIVFSYLFEQLGYVNNNLMHIADWFPTLYAAGGGDIKDLGVLDGVNQWGSISQNLTTNRNDLLVNIDEILGYSGFIGEFGRFKLVNGSFPGGIYDGYVGENGRGSENPPYNIQAILDSPANVALSSNLSKRTIEEIRQNLDLKNCRNQDFKVDCNKTLCLFDLKLDPCETTNLAEEKPTIAQNLYNQMISYYPQIKGQTLSPVDDAANPELCGNLHFTWLEKNGCPVNAAFNIGPTWINLLGLLIYTFKF